MYNNGLMIDSNSVINIINSLKLNIELEEKLIVNIINTINNLNNNYTGINSKLLISKKDNLSDALNTMIDNRKRVVCFLDRMISNYILLNEKETIRYSNLDIN